MVRPPKIAFREQFFDDEIAAQSKRRRAEHCDQLGKTARHGEHFFRLGEIVRHARLAKNVFARFERGDRHRRMHVGRRADPDDVDVRDRDCRSAQFCIGIASGA